MHIQFAANLDLEAEPVLRWLSIAILHQEFLNSLGQCGAWRGVVAIAPYKICVRQSWKLSCMAAGNSWHAMKVDVDVVSVTRLGSIDTRLHRQMVGLPTAGYAQLYLLGAQGASVKRQPIVSGAPNQALTQFEFGQNTRVARLYRVGPSVGKHIEINFSGVAVGVQVAGEKWASTQAPHSSDAKL